MSAQQDRDVGERVMGWRPQGNRWGEELNGGNAME